MLVDKLSFTTKGNRLIQLDRVGYYHGYNWSVAYILDGFIESTPHFVDCVNRNLQTILGGASQVQSLDSLKKLIFEAINSDIKNEGKASIAVIICVDRSILILTAGDTRVYNLSERTRTTDHSRAQELVSSGKLRKDLLNQNAFRKYLTKKIYKDMKETLLDEKVQEQVKKGSKFVICSDGFWSDFNEEKEIYDLDINALKLYLGVLDINTLSDNTSVILLEKQ